MVENPHIPQLRGTFEVLDLGWQVQQLLFPTATDMIDQGYKLKQCIQCKYFP